MSKDADDIAIKQVAIKSTGRGGKHNFPSTVEPEDANDVRAALASVLRWHSTGKDKVITVDEWDNRTDQFFDECYIKGERPTWEKYCLAVGHPLSTVWAWMNGTRTQDERIVGIIKRSREIIMSYDAEMVTTGKMRDTPYIFRAKNWYGMKDTQDVIVTPNSPLQTDTNPVDIANKYNALPED